MATVSVGLREATATPSLRLRYGQPGPGFNMRRLKIRRSLPKHMLVMVTFVGVVSGYYIWQKPLEQYSIDHGYTAVKKSEEEHHTQTPSLAPGSAAGSTKSS